MLVKQCLVTGGNGFLGRHLLQLLLLQKVAVRALLRKPQLMMSPIETLIGDLLENHMPYEAALMDVDTVFHLANIAHARKTYAQYQDDCNATIKLALEAQKAGVTRFVYVSSTKAMAPPGVIKRDETWSQWPDDAYGYWKRMTEQRLLEEVSIPHIAILRPCLVYGCGVKGNLQRMIQQINRGFFPPLPETGAERSMVAAIDVASALLLAAIHPDANRSPLIVSDGERYTANAIYKAILQSLGKAAPGYTVPVDMLKFFGRTGDVLSRLWAGCPVTSQAMEALTGAAAYSSSKLCRLGWEPSTTFYAEVDAVVATCLETA